MMHFRSGLSGAAAAISGLPVAALANQPVDGGIGMLPAASKLAEEVHFFHNGILMPIITVICLFVLGLLLWIAVRYNSKANPTPKKFSHNTLLEVVWTGVPILILVFISLYSFELLYKEEIIPDGKKVVAPGDGAASAFVVVNDFPGTRRLTRPDHVQVFLNSTTGERLLKRGADYSLAGLGQAEVTIKFNTAPARGEDVVIKAGRSLVGAKGFFGCADDCEIALAPSVTLKVIGNQWNWRYAYPDYGDFDFISSMLPEDKTTKDFYHFEVDNRVFVPVGETVRVTTTASDVIHSWALPNFAIKIDAVPGRHNETWFKAEKEGVYYGQCSEICGVKHAFMPIAVEVVSREAFCSWVAARQTEFAIARTDEQRRAEPVCGALMGPLTVASASAQFGN